SRDSRELNEWTFGCVCKRHGYTPIQNKGERTMTTENIVHAWKAKTKLFWRTDGHDSSPAATDFKVETGLQPVDVTMKTAESNLVAFRKKQTTRRISICLLSRLLLFPLLITLRTQAQRTAAAFDLPVASVQYVCLDCGGSFTVHSYQGRLRCLDYT